MSAFDPKPTSHGQITGQCPPFQCAGLCRYDAPARASGGGEMMSPWHLLQRYRQYTNHALWVVPFSAIILELVLYRLLRALDDMLGWQLQRFSASGAQAMLEAIITMALSFVVFTFGSLLVAIQVASGQLTPRIIATTLLRDNVVRYTVGLFVFTLLFAISVLNRVEGTSHQLVLFVAGL